MGIFSTLALGAYLYFSYSPFQFVNFNKKNHQSIITESLNRDYYWLIPDGMDCKAEQLLDSNKDTIKILLVDGQEAGFISYYMKNPIHGFIHFLNIKPELRNKGYAEELIKFAIADLKKQGAIKISLMTRTDNIPAQKVYKKLGFSEKTINEKYVDFFLRLDR